MNTSNGAAWIAVGLLAGVGLSTVAWVGSQVYQSNRESNRVTESQPAASTPTEQTQLAQQPVEAPAPVAPVVTPPQPVAFNQLSPCDQLDSLARAGKSVSEFLVAANQVNDLAKYQAAIGSTCPWNNEQLAVADRIINPPVVVQPPVAQQPRNTGDRTVIVRERPAPAWNNCNGIQEPGESYSARCETAQEMNDAGVGNRWSERVDNRPPDGDPVDPGRRGPANGYSSQP